MKWHAQFGQVLALALLCGQATAAEVYMSADDYLMGSQQERWGFVQGVYDTYGAMADLDNIVDPRLNEVVHGLTECAIKVSVNELEQTFTTWLESNPDRWNEKMPSLFLTALGAQCAGSHPTQAQGANAAASN
ncbi:MAG: hypothetical protein ACTSW2_09175 [Alphaproteobacteria bacterium]